MIKKNIVIKVGGSLLFTEERRIRSEFISEFCNIIKHGNNFDIIVIVCGGGILARDYINIIRKLGKNEAFCDIIGIKISQINSQIILACLNGYAYPRVPLSLEELSIATISKKIVVMGGLQPGQSTTSVAIEVAEYLDADNLVILTDVPGIFDKDPKKHKDASLLKNVSYDKMQEILLTSFNGNQAAAGEYRIFDIVSLQILKRSNIDVLVMNGKDLTELKKYWNGQKDFNGTIISK
ncbi:MAG: UMP kinase [Candidatus Thorarchaeota archaeon]